MSVTTRLASSLGRNDEKPNVVLAETIVKKSDTKAISELAEALVGKDKAIRSDAIKVLYEVGERAPKLIATHLDVFVSLLASKDNRMVWGAMCAVDAITVVKPKEVFAALPKVLAAVDKGSVITRDHAVKAMVKLAADAGYAKRVMPLLLEQLRTCPMNQLPMYTELVATIAGRDPGSLINVLQDRLAENMPASKRTRIEKVLRRLQKS